MTPSQKFLKKLGLKDQDNVDEIYSTEKIEVTENKRRSFLKKSALGGITLGGALMFSPIEELVAQSTQKVIPPEADFFKKGATLILCYFYFF